MSNPGRQSLLIPSTTKDDTELITFTDSRHGLSGWIIVLN